MRINSIKSAIVFLPLLTLFVSHCGTKAKSDESTTDVKSQIPDIGTIMINLPSAVAPSSTSLHLASDSDAGIKALLLIPVGITGAANTMTALTKSIVEHLFGKAICRDQDSSNDEADCANLQGIISGEISETPTVFTVPASSVKGGAPDFVKFWKNPAGSAYDVSVELYFKGQGTDQAYFPSLQLDLSKTGEESGKGRFSFFPNLSQATKGDAPDTIVASFVASDDQKSLDLRMYYSTPKAGAANALGLKVSADAEGIISGSGTVIRPSQSTASGVFVPFQSKEEYAFVYTLAANTAQNIAVEKVAAVQAANYSDANFFSNFGVDTLLSNFALDLLRGTVGLYDCSLHGKVISSSLPSNICKNQTSVSDTDVLAGFKTFCVSNPTNALCTSAGTYDQWGNPIYLNGDGYVGNENHGKPTASGYASLKTTLDGITSYSPTSLLQATIPSPPSSVKTFP